MLLPGLTSQGAPVRQRDHTCAQYDAARWSDRDRPWMCDWHRQLPAAQKRYSLRAADAALAWAKELGLLKDCQLWPPEDQLRQDYRSSGIKQRDNFPYRRTNMAGGKPLSSLSASRSWRIDIHHVIRA